MTAIYTAKIVIERKIDERMIACLDKTVMLSQVGKWRREFPGKKVKYETIMMDERR
jgi:hypothetical protein